MRFYILSGQTPIETDWERFCEWFGKVGLDGRRVAVSELPQGYEVSTVFLGLDHAWGKGPPLIFETMVFGPDGDGGEYRRCSTWAQAVSQHDDAVSKWKRKLLH